MKICGICGRPKETVGIKVKRWRCKPCSSARNLVHYHANKARRRAQIEAWRSKNEDRVKAAGNGWRQTVGRPVMLWSGARRRANKDGIPFTLSLDRVKAAIERGRCEVTGLDFELGAGRSPWAPSLDRESPLLGYTNENTRIVVWLFNAAKNKFTDEDVLRLSAALLARHAEGAAK